MLIAVTGASGFVGRHVTALLARRGHHVRALVRRDGRGTAAEGLPADRTPGDLADPAALAALTRGADVVVHLVGIIVEAGAATFEGVHVDGTGRLLDLPPGVVTVPVKSLERCRSRVSSVRSGMSRGIVWGGTT